MQRFPLGQSASRRQSWHVTKLPPTQTPAPLAASVAQEQSVLLGSLLSHSPSVLMHQSAPATHVLGGAAQRRALPRPVPAQISPAQRGWLPAQG